MATSPCCCWVTSAPPSSARSCRSSRRRGTRILKVGHHGSRTSTSQELLDALAAADRRDQLRPRQHLRPPRAGSPRAASTPIGARIYRTDRRRADHDRHRRRARQREDVSTRERERNEPRRSRRSRRTPILFSRIACGCRRLLRRRPSMRDVRDDWLRDSTCIVTSGRDFSSQSIERRCNRNEARGPVVPSLNSRYRSSTARFRYPGSGLISIVESLIVVELKAVARFDEVHRAQVISYLRTTGLRGGLADQLSCARAATAGLKRIVL